MKRLATVLAGLGLVLAIAPPALSGAAADTADTSLPINPATQLEMHTRVDCQLATKQCTFSTAANLLTDGNVTGFPEDLWGRQSTTLRSSDRLSYFETDINGGYFTKRFKSGGSVVLTTLYYADGPPEKYTINGTITPVDWATGLPKTDGDVIVCAHVQVVYTGVNITSPDTCAQTTFS